MQILRTPDDRFRGSHVTLRGGHFVQEDCPGEIVELIDGFIRG